MIGIPLTLETDAEDVAWALQTADALWKRSERVDAIVWLRRAAQAAGDAEDDDRALALARARGRHPPRPPQPARHGEATRSRPLARCASTARLRSAAPTRRPPRRSRVSAGCRSSGAYWYHSRRTSAALTTDRRPAA